MSQILDIQVLVRVLHLYLDHLLAFGIWNHFVVPRASLHRA